MSMGHTVPIKDATFVYKYIILKELVLRGDLVFQKLFWKKSLL